MLLSRNQTFLLIGALFCALAPWPSLAMNNPATHSDINEIELVHAPTPIPRPPVTPPKSTQEMGYWERLKDFATRRFPEGAARGARIAAYTGARLIGDAGRAVGIESVDKFGLQFDVGTNVKRDVITALSSREMAKYFPDKTEIETIATRIDERVRAEALNGVVTNVKAVRAIELATAETSGTIIDRIMDTEGIKDEARRQEWRGRLLAPFQVCTSSAKTHSEAQDCRKSLSSSIPANLTMATAYELARTELKGLSGNPAKETAAAIKSSLQQCWTPEAEVEKNIDCLKAGARTGMREIATRKIDSLLPSAIQEKEPKLKHQLVEDLVQCVGNEASSGARSTSRVSALDYCKKDIALSAGVRIGSSIIPAEIESFIKKRGGLESLQMTQAEKEQFVKSTLDSQAQCFRQAENGMDTEDLLDICLRTSIRDVSLALGTKVLDQRAKKYLGSSLDESSKREFREDFSECIKDLNLKNYHGSLDRCENQMTRDYTVKFARQALGTIVSEGLPDDPRGRKLVTDRLERRLGEMSKATDQNQLDAKVHELKRSAAYEIVTRALGEEAKKQLKTDKLPKELAEHETKLKKGLEQCLAENRLKPEICARQYAVEMIKKIGAMLLKDQIAQLRKTKGLKPSPTLQGDLEKYLNTCVDNIKASELNEEFKAGVKDCVAQLEKRAIVLVAKNEVIPKVTAKTRGKETRRKTEAVLEDAIDCLTELNGLGLPSSKKGGGDIRGLLKIVQSYYDYDTKAANRSLEAALGDVKKDLQSYGAEVAQEKLLENMARHGVIDQLIKAAVRDQVKEGFKSVKRGDLPSQRVLNQILDTKNFDKIFNRSVMAKIRPVFIANILRPALLQGKSIQDLTRETNRLKNDVSLILAQSPHFGRMIANASVQKSLDKVDGMTRFFAHMMYGERALNWDRVPDSPAKRRAREYIQSNLVYPKIAGTRLGSREEARRHKIAQDLVTEAIKSPRAPSPQRRWIAREP